MRGYHLAFNRLKQDWQYQTSILRSVFDWTIIIYLLIPTLVFAGAAYQSWWRTVPEMLNGFSPLMYFLVCFFLICWQGTMRTFMDDADQLYLLQYSKKVIEMRYIGTLYSLFHLLVKWLLVFGLLYPLTNHFEEVGIGKLVSVISYLFSLNLLLVAYQQVVYNFRFFRKLFLDGGVFILFTFLTFLMFKQMNILTLFMLATIFGCLALWQIRRYQLQYKTFHTDVEKEKNQKIKYSKMIFAINPEIHMPKLKKAKKRSWVLWRNSNRIYLHRSPENGVTELFIKAFFREKSNIFSYMQLVSVTTMIIFITPIWLKWLIFIAFWFFFKKWLLLLFKDILIQNPYLAIDFGNEKYIFQAQKKCETLFVLPGFIFIFFITGLSTVLKIIL